MHVKPPRDASTKRESLRNHGAVPQICFEEPTISLYKMSPRPPRDTRQSAPKRLHLRGTGHDRAQTAPTTLTEGKNKNRRTYAPEDTR